jgi:hypothetical protein
MPRTVLFADILGFGNLARAPGATGAKDALSDVAYLLATDDELVQFLRQPVWKERYGLSDSIFLVAEDPVGACVAGVELFFDLAYVNHSTEAPVLIRGALAQGEADQVKPIFPESAQFNLVGEAVVRAVALEEKGPKGPRLLLAEEMAAAWEQSSQPQSWLLDRIEGQAELLWLLPPDPAASNGLLIGEVCGTALRLVREHGANPRFGYHYIGYLDLVLRSLQRLLERNPSEGEIARRICGLAESRAAVQEVLMPRINLEAVLLQRLRDLTG